MTDINATVERISSANPVPAADSFPTGALSSERLLARIDERSSVMTDTLTPIRTSDPGKSPRRRGPLLALAVAAVLILIIGITSFALLRGDEGGEVVDEPTREVDEPRQDVDEPAPDSLQDPFPADTSPLDVVAAISGAWEVGDIEAADALIHPDSPYWTQIGDVSEEIWYRIATGVAMESECFEGTPARLGAYEPIGVVVTCNDTLISGLAPETVIGGGTVAFDIADGWVQDFLVIAYVGAVGEFEMPQYRQYLNWLEQRDPQNVDNLYVPRVGLAFSTEEQRAKHREMVPMFLADVGPREADPLALPADASLLDTVAVFNERFDSGDIEGYEALFHPLSGYPSGQDAENSWFNAVTGQAAERNCVALEFTQVRCEEVVFSGLLPGTVVTEVTTLWNGMGGYIWSIDFPDGPPPGWSDTSQFPGVAEYRTWVEQNAPEAIDLLFVEGGAMRLDTEEARAGHVAMVDRFLAATSG